MSPKYSEVGRGWPEDPYHPITPSHSPKQPAQPEPETSLHHLFTKQEVLAALNKALGEPTTSGEAAERRRMAAIYWKKIPTIRINHQHHKRLHEGT